MTDKEAGEALAASEPEIEWSGVGGRQRSSTESVERWDRWNARRIKALNHFSGSTT